MKKKTFSFFYAKGGSGYQRGHQVAEYLGAKENPEKGFKSDICIYTKITPPENHPKHTYCDVDDSLTVIPYIKRHPEVGVIATSIDSKDYLEKELGRKDIIVIPHHHCNRERLLRPDRPVKVVGIIGSKTSFQYPVDLFKKEIEKIGLELVYEEDYWNTYKTTTEKEMRLKVSEFYYAMDIQVIWRPKSPFLTMRYFRNPNKIGNSSSFGIPTVSYPEANYVKEWGGRFIQVSSIDRMIRACKELKNNQKYYSYYAKKALAYAETRHIETIIKLYKALK